MPFKFKVIYKPVTIVIIIVIIIIIIVILSLLLLLLSFYYYSYYYYCHFIIIIIIIIIIMDRNAVELWKCFSYRMGAGRNWKLKDDKKTTKRILAHWMRINDSIPFLQRKYVGLNRIKSTNSTPSTGYHIQFRTRQRPTQTLLMMSLSR